MQGQSVYSWQLGKGELSDALDGVVVKKDVDDVGSKAGESPVWDCAQLVFVSDEVFEVLEGLEVLPREVNKGVVVEDKACWVGSAESTPVDSE